MAQRAVPLSEIAVPKGLVGGPFGSSLVNKDYVVSPGVPVIRGTNLGYGQHISGEFVYVSEEKYAADLARNSAAPGDLIFTQRGTLGQVAIVPDDSFPVFVVSQSQMRLRVDQSVAVPTYVYYACSSAQFNRQISDSAISTGVPHINLGILNRLSIPLPPLDEQRAIAEVLGALDDKIAANTKLAETAMELASEIYNQGVAGFPDKPMDEVLTPILGGTPARGRNEFWGGSVPWASAKDVTGADMGVITDTEEKITEQASSSTKAKPLPEGSVILTARGTVGAVARLATPAAFNQSCYGFVPGALPPALLYFGVLSAANRAKKIAHGSVFDTITMKTFAHLPLPDMPETEIEKLESLLAPQLRVTTEAVRENRTLAATRDALLPQLMSGNLRVRDIENTMGEMV